MSTEGIAICSNCLLTFGSHEEVLGHTCNEIKEERIEVDEMVHDEKDNLSENKPNISENDSDYIPENIKSEKNHLKKKGTKKKRPKKHEPEIKIKVETNKYQDDIQNDLIGSSNVELSEQFAAFILSQVDELCEIIKNGDPDIKRTMDVNQKLNDAVDCYRIISKLDLEKEIFADTGYGDEIEMDSDNDYGTKDFLYDPKFPIKKTKILKVLKVPKGKKKSEGKVGRPNKKVGGRPRKKSNDEKFELVKTQCGRHTLPKLAMMLNIPKSSLHCRIKEEGITFPKKIAECVFCDMEKNMVEIKNDELLAFLRFNHDEDKFECSICNILLKDRPRMYDHLKEKHKNEINARTVPNTQLENNQDCDGTICAKVYGNKGKKFWCQICKLPLQLAKDARKEPKVCPECGKSVHNLTGHRVKHYQEKHHCSLCPSVFRSRSYLDIHKKAVHEKVPCTECGKLFGAKVMKRHIEAAHTPDDQKRFKCDICGKGFSAKQRLEEHKNVHTGEKPHKCKFCSALFASFGNLRMHERGHLGHKRK